MAGRLVNLDLREAAEGEALFGPLGVVDFSRRKWPGDQSTRTWGKPRRVRRLTPHPSPLTPHSPQPSALSSRPSALTPRPSPLTPNPSLKKLGKAAEGEALNARGEEADQRSHATRGRGILYEKRIEIKPFW